jgi:hypothetical protein
MAKDKKKKNRTEGMITNASAAIVLTEEQVVPIIEKVWIGDLLNHKLKATNIDDRAWACISISHLVSDPIVLGKLLNANLLPCLEAALDDPEERIVLEVLGALRNVLVSGGEDCCQKCLLHSFPTKILNLIPRVGELFLI